MMKKTARIFILMLSFVLCFSAIGCSDSTGGGLGDDDKSKLITITAFMPLESWSLGAFENRDFAENEVIKEIEKKFNVKFKFTHPTTGKEADQFGLMVLDKTLPDLIFSPNWYVGGVEQGIKDKIYRDITDEIPLYMPNLDKILKEDVELNRLIKTDSKQIGSIHGVSLYEEYPFYGAILKAKWLEDVGEAVPETIADWERVLTKFKNEKNATAPFALDPSGYDYTSGTFLSAYGVAPDFYLDDGVVKYGPMESGFYSYLNLMRDWITKGLISPSFSEKDWNSLVSDMKGKASGAIMQSPDTMSVHLESAGVSWTAAPYPVINKGDKINFRQKGSRLLDGWGNSAAISSSCKNVKRVMEVLDYGFSKEGETLYNFGIKDRAYTEKEDGTKAFTDLIYNNEYGYSTLQALWRYKVHTGVFVRDEHNANPVLIKNDESLAARKSWADVSTSNNLPPLKYTRGEAQEIGKAMDNVNKYLKKEVLAFLTGAASSLSTTNTITNSAKFQVEMRKLGIDKIIAHVSTAYARYQERA